MLLAAVILGLLAAILLAYLFVVISDRVECEKERDIAKASAVEIANLLTQAIRDRDEPRAALAEEKQITEHWKEKAESAERESEALKKLLAEYDHWSTGMQAHFEATRPRKAG